MPNRFDEARSNKSKAAITIDLPSTYEIDPAQVKNGNKPTEAELLLIKIATQFAAIYKKLDELEKTGDIDKDLVVAFHSEYQKNQQQDVIKTAESVGLVVLGSITPLEQMKQKAPEPPPPPK